MGRKKRMTETAWLTCADPAPMLEFLRERASDRKLRLFTVACCFRIWVQFTDSRSCNAIEVAERYADELATVEERIAAEKSAKAGWHCRMTKHPFSGFPHYAALCTVLPRALDRAGQCADAVATMVAFAAYEAYRASLPVPNPPYNDTARETITTSRGSEASTQATFLRDLFGNPFRPIALNPAWVTSEVRAMAQVIYDEKKFEDLPVLADALEDAGCTSADVLAHLRSPGPHVRGCWALDLILGKE
jgi:hypothetical protein